MVTDYAPALEMLYEKLRPDIRLLHNARQNDVLPLVCARYLQRGKTLYHELFEGEVHSQPCVYRNFPQSEKSHSESVVLQVARMLENQSHLLASIILPSTYNTHQDSLYQIIHTVVYQIARNIPSCAKYILDAINNKPEIFDLDSQTQLHDLIEAPLLKAARDIPQSHDIQWRSIIVVHGLSSQLTENHIAQRFEGVIDRLRTAVGPLRALKLVAFSTESPTLAVNTPLDLMMVANAVAAHRLTIGIVALQSCYFGLRVVHESVL